ncbi:MAG: hypothetical protein KAH48_06235 [Chlorobi bacterium]|nr:hypothetical protein [Chlorobiota bacterium]
MKNLLLIVFMAIFTSSLYAGQWNPGEDITDQRDGQVYKTVVIGEQVWMAENLNYGNMIQSTKPGYEMSDNSIFEKYCWENDEENCDGAETKMKRGAFYEWREAMQYWDGQPELPVKGVCPQGWHIPSSDEWNTLLNFAGGQTAYTSLLEGGESGFNALLTGYRCTMTGAFRVSATAADTRTYYWTSQHADAENAPLLEIGANSLTSFAFSKSLGLCIRCIMDETTDVEDETDHGSNSIMFNTNPEIFNGSGTFRFNVDRFSAANLDISVINTNGTTVSHISQGQSYSPGFHEINVNTIDLSSGMYLLVISDGVEIQSKPIMIVK